MKKLRLVSICALLAILLIPISARATLLSTLEVVDPISEVYTFGVDYLPFSDTSYTFPALGDVTAPLQFVPNFGDTASDFVDFTAGNIALIERGLTYFSTKVNNAAAAGAVGVIIYNNFVQPIATWALFDSTTIPSVGTTNAVGLELLGFLNEGAITVHLAVEEMHPIPEPATMLLLSSGLIGLFGFRRKFRK